MKSKQLLLILAVIILGLSTPNVVKIQRPTQDCDAKQQDMKSILAILATQNPLCAEWKGDACLKCAPRSYFNSNRICIEVDKQCSDFDQKSSRCNGCYAGYALQNGKCVQAAVQVEENCQARNPLCGSWKSSKCERCSPRAYFDRNGICIAVSPDCRTFSENTGQCLSCYDGFRIDKGKCLQAGSTFGPESDPLCAQWANKKCIRCASRCFFNQKGLCQASDPNCASFDQNSGQCLSCYSGYQLAEQKCILTLTRPAQPDTKSNPLCAQWSGQKCARCSQRSYFQEGGLCVEVDPYCENFSYEKRACLKCYDGYGLKGDICSISKTPAVISKGYDDPLCAVWESPSKCQRCSSGSCFNQNGRCEAYDANCIKFDEKQRICQSCSQGFVAILEKCVRFLEPSFELDKCMAWRDNRCVECAAGLQLSSNNTCSCPK